MAGIYVHIPFCKTRCVYCGFYSTTLHALQEKYVNSVIREFRLRSDYTHEPFLTTYIGGGTPSFLNTDLLERLFSVLPKTEEFTVECNPDDITPTLAHIMKSNGVNRVSMGVQTFSAERLRFLNRRHSANQAKEAVKVLREAGIGNISIDLMFGFPGETLEEWMSDIDQAIALGVEHISAYSLMYEEGTPLYRMLEEGKIEEIDEEVSRQMYYTLISKLEAAGFEQYEISNFARPGYRSRHNSSYWKAVPYIGLGAGAHSYDGQSRQWNIDDVNIYINKVDAGELPFEREELDATTKYNDMITTALRTREGIKIGDAPFSDYLFKQAQPLIREGLLALEDDHLRLTRKGLYTSDDIMTELILLP